MLPQVKVIIGPFGCVSFVLVRLTPYFWRPTPFLFPISCWYVNAVYLLSTSLSDLLKRSPPLSSQPVLVNLVSLVLVQPLCAALLVSPTVVSYQLATSHISAISQDITVSQLGSSGLPISTPTTERCRPSAVEWNVG